MMEFETPAMPIPAAMLERTMEMAVQRPIVSGPTMSIKGKVVMSIGYLALWMMSDITPIRPQEKRNPNPMLKVSLVNFIKCLKTIN